MDFILHCVVAYREVGKSGSRVLYVEQRRGDIENLSLFKLETVA